MGDGSSGICGFPALYHTGNLFGLGYVAAFSHPPFLLRGTLWIILLNCAFRQISVGCKAANGAFATMDEKTEMAARDMGATALEILFGIVFPQLKQVFKICLSPFLLQQ